MKQKFAFDLSKNLTEISWGFFCFFFFLFCFNTVVHSKHTKLKRRFWLITNKTNKKQTKQTTQRRKKQLFWLFYRVKKIVEHSSVVELINHWIAPLKKSVASVIVLLCYVQNCQIFQYVLNYFGRLTMYFFIFSTIASVAFSKWAYFQCFKTYD